MYFSALTRWNFKSNLLFANYNSLMLNMNFIVLMLFDKKPFIKIVISDYYLIKHKYLILKYIYFRHCEVKSLWRASDVWHWTCRVLFHWDVMMSQLLTDQVTLVMKQCSVRNSVRVTDNITTALFRSENIPLQTSIPQERRDGQKHISQSELGFAKIVLSVALMWFIKQFW